MRRPALTAAAALALAPFAVCGPGAPPATVAVRVWPSSGPAELATGVVSGPGRVVTVAHVLDAGRRVEVTGPDGRRRRAAVLDRDRALDLAVLDVEGLPAPRPAVPAGLSGGGAGAVLRVLVRRDGGVRTWRAVVRRRIFARLVDQPGRPRRPTLELAMDVAAGDSGAPVIDADGRLVAVVFARSDRRGATAYAVRGSGLLRLLCRAGGRC